MKDNILLSQRKMKTNDDKINILQCDINSCQKYLFAEPQLCVSALVSHIERLSNKSRANKYIIIRKAIKAGK